MITGGEILFSLGGADGVAGLHFRGTAFRRDVRHHAVGLRCRGVRVEVARQHHRPDGACRRSTGATHSASRSRSANASRKQEFAIKSRVAKEARNFNNKILECNAVYALRCRKGLPIGMTLPAGRPHWTPADRRVLRGFRETVVRMGELLGPTISGVRPSASGASSGTENLRWYVEARKAPGITRAGQPCSPSFGITK